MRTKVVNGWTLLYDEEDDGYVRWSLKSDSWQNGMIHQAMSWCTDFNNAIDIGSCYGASARILAKNFKQVHAIEMYPKFIECAKINTKEFSNIKWYNYVIGDFNGKVTINSALYGGRSTLKHNERLTKAQLIVYRDEEKTITPSRKFSLWVSENELDEISLIKCDIEHYEKFFIEYGIGVFDKFKPVIVVELMYESEQQYAVETLKKIGYALVERSRNDFIFAHEDKQLSELKGKRQLYGGSSIYV